MTTRRAPRWELTYRKGSAFSPFPLRRHPKESAPRFIRTQGDAVQGKVVIRRDAGQVVAGNAVTNIENYVAAHPSRCVLAVAFFSA